MRCSSSSTSWAPRPTSAPRLFWRPCTSMQKASPPAWTDLQAELLHRNPGWAQLQAAAAPDGDADLEGCDFSGFEVPACAHCGSGPLKPDVVFFGENVPR